jgi:glutamine synthetase
MEGIKNNIQPPALTEGDAYSNKELKRPPVDLAEALEYFENSEFIRRTFGEEFHRHYTSFYKNEVMKYERNVTKWESQRYFDLV